MYKIFGAPGAAAHISGNPAFPDLRGKALFYVRPTGVLMEFEVSGLPADSETGFFALHVHAGEDCGGESFSDTGPHLNPTGTQHPLHAGDLPPLLSAGGRAYMAVLSNRFTLPEILEKTVVIHALPDDFRTQPAGGAGEKIGCGVIKKM